MAEIDQSANWRVVQDFPLYEVSSEGVIRLRFAHHQRPKHWPAGYVIKQSLNGKIRSRRIGGFNDNRYLSVSLYKEGGKRYPSKLVHRIVCEAFHGVAPANKHEVAHFDGNKRNNNAANLRWVTSSENTQDNIRLGTVACGERCGSSKLTADQVQTIRLRLINGDFCNSIAKDYGVSDNTINEIRNKKNWRYLPWPEYQHADKLIWKMKKDGHGERNGSSKLTANQVIEIKKMIAVGAKGIDIAKKYSVSASTISAIRKQKSWSHLKA